jgi:hypothetical protein
MVLRDQLVFQDQTVVLDHQELQEAQEHQVNLVYQELQVVLVLLAQPATQVQ